MTSRREFLKTGLLGGLLLSLGGCASPPADQRRSILQAIALAILQGAAPKMESNPALLGRTVENVELTIAGLPLATQAELDQLFGLLSSPLGRCLVAGLWSPWASATPEEVSRFLTSWRFSRFSLLRSAYAGLHDLVLGAWYSETDTWAAIGYPGPPKVR